MIRSGSRLTLINYSLHMLFLSLAGHMKSKASIGERLTPRVSFVDSEFHYSKTRRWFNMDSFKKVSSFKAIKYTRLVVMKAISNMDKLTKVPESLTSLTIGTILIKRKLLVPKSFKNLLHFPTRLNIACIQSLPMSTSISLIQIVSFNLRF